MAQGSRPERVGEEIRQEISLLLAREVHDPGIGFVTITRVKMSPDLQQARVYYTLLGDERARKETARALDRAKPFLRRQIGSRIRLRRVPDLTFQIDLSIEHQDRVEQLLMEIAEERKARGESEAPDPPEAPDTDDESGGRS
jgi:ribosome-binding factor A